MFLNVLIVEETVGACSNNPPVIIYGFEQSSDGVESYLALCESQPWL
jgi:hypothetical protein